jgi:hypothetical protein
LDPEFNILKPINLNYRYLSLLGIVGGFKDQIWIDKKKRKHAVEAMLLGLHFLLLSKNAT